MDSNFLEWFLQQVNAQKDSITEGQIKRFCFSPDGPILPESCVSVERLPDTFWKHDHGTEADRLRGYAFDPLNEPYRLREIRGHGHALISRQGALSASEPVSNWYVHLAGWKEYRTPVLLGREIAWDFPHTSTREKNRLEVERRTEIRVGAQVAYCSVGLKHLSVLADGSLMWIEWTSADNQTFRIVRDGNVVVERTGRAYTRFLQLPGTSEIVGIWKNADGEGGIGWIEDERRSIAGDILDAVRDEDGTVLLVGTLAGDKNRAVYAFDPDAIQVGQGRCQYLDGYIGGYRTSPNGRIGSLGDFIQRSRHGCQRWVIYRNGFISQPSFAAVSPIFEQDGRRRYYGINDRHLCLMELPDNIK